MRSFENQLKIKQIKEENDRFTQIEGSTPSFNLLHI